MEYLQTKSRLDLIDDWTETFGKPPAKKTSTTLMQAALAYEIQCGQSGGLSKRGLRLLATLAKPSQSKGKDRRTRAAPGAHLVREWNGRSYQVAVVEGGYVLDGKTYASLSAVAKHITGAHWSGPRFFGVSG